MCAVRRRSAHRHWRPTAHTDATQQTALSARPLRTRTRVVSGVRQAHRHAALRMSSRRRKLARVAASWRECN